MTISTDGLTKSYSFPVAQFGSFGDIIMTDLEEPVKWKGEGKISFYYYGNTEVDIALFQLRPSRLEENEGVDLPRP